MSSNAKSTRDRAPKCSIVLNNVLAVVFRPTSTAVQIDEVAENTEKPPHQMTGSELFDAFKESNRSTMLTRLNESLDEIRLKGWIFPFTLLIKGPHEDVEVVKEAWRRHFLRSPDGFIIRDIGAVSSIGMEVIQQAPFLPLTKSLVETIAALNGSKLAATQQSITEYLAKTYQYVHVPKIHVIHDCLGILIKERTIYHTGNGYFVSKRNTVEKSTDAPKENGDAKERCVACEGNSKGKAGKTENGKKRNRVKEKESGKEKGKGKNRSSTREEESSEPKASIEKAEKGNTDERKGSKSEITSKKEEQCIVPSETASVSSGEGTNKKTKKQKKGVLNQISCFIKGRTFSTTEIPEGTKHEQTQTTPYLPSPPANNTADQPNAPLAEPEMESPTLLRNERSVHFRQNRTLSAPAGNRYMQENETRMAPVEFRTKNVKTEPSNYQELISSVTRSRSFVASAGKHPKPVARSNSFTAPSGRTARPLSTDMATGTWETRLRLNYGDIIRNAPARRTIHVSRPSSCNIGIVRPLDTSHQRPLSRSNSVKREAPRKKGGSLSPSSTPRLREKAVEHRDLTGVVRRKSFTEPTSFRSSTNRYDSRRATIGPYYHNSPVQPLVKKAAPHVSPLSPKVRITVPSKGKARAPVKHMPPAPKKTSPKSPTQKQQKKPAGLPAAPAKREVPQPVPQPRNDNCSSPICYDKSMVNVKVDNCKCNFGVNNDEVKYNPYLHADYRGANQKYPCLPSNGVSSEKIFLEELTSTASSASSEATLNEEEAYEQTAETKPLGMYQKINGEGVNDSLTFIGII